MDVALLVSDPGARAALSEAVCALGHSLSILESAEQLAPAPVATVIVGSASDRDLIAAVRRWSGSSARILAVSDEACAPGAIEAGADDVIPAACPLPVLRARLGCGSHAEQALRASEPGTLVEVLASAFPVRDALGEVVATGAIGRDMSERAAAEEEARRLAALVENSDDAITARDLQGRFIVWNKGAEAIYGYSQAEVLEGSADLLIPPGGETTEDLWRAILAGSNGERRVVTRRRKDGSDFDLALSLFPVRDSAGTLVAVGGIGRDVTVEKEVERELARLAAIVENSEDAVLGTDFEGHITYWSPGAERLYGYTSEEAGGCTLAELLVPRDRLDELRSHGDQVIAGRAATFETVRRCKDGRLVDVSMSVFQVRDRDGTPTGLASVARDISARNAAERELREAQEFLSAILANAPVVTVALDKHGVYTFTGGAAMDGLGLTPGAAVGRSIFDYSSSPEIHENARAALAGEARSFAWTFGERTLQTNISPVRDEHGEVSGAIAVSFDITKRTHAEAARRESEARFRALSETSAAAIIAFSGTHVLYANSAFRELVGYDTDEISADGFVSRMLHPDDLPMVRERVLARLGGDDLSPWMEYRVIRKDGEVRWVRSSSASCVFDGIPAAVGTTIDITEQRQAQEALTESEEKFRALSGAATAAIWAHDETGILYANEAFLELTGYPLETVLAPGSFLTDIVHPDFREMAVTERAAHYAGTAPAWAVEGKIVTARAEERWVRVSGASMTLNGRPAAVSTAIDITERKQMEDALREGEEKFRAFAEHTSAALLAFRRDGDLFYANRSLGRLTGYSYAELTAPDFFREHVLHADDRDVLLRAAANLMRGDERPASAEFRVRCKDGSIRWLQVSGASFQLGGEVAAMVTGFDITDRKAAEEALRDSEGQFRAFAETTSAALIAFRGNDIYYANGALAELTGYSPAEIQEDNFFLAQMVDPRDLALVAERGGALLRGDARLPSFEFRIRHRDGSLRWLEVNGSRFEFGGQPAAIVTGFDVTERKLTEESLRESEERFRALAESSTAAVTAFDARRIIYANRAFRELVGYDADEIGADGFMDRLVHPDHAESPGIRLTALFEGGDVEPWTEYRIVRKDGAERWVRASSASCLFAGAPAGVTTTIDITDQKLAEDGLRESEEKFRAFTDSSQTAIWAYSGARTFYANQALFDLTGYSWEEISQERFFLDHVCAPDFRAAVERRRAERLAGATLGPELVGRIFRKDGEERWIRLTGGNFTLNGEPAAVAHAIDITDRVQSEAALRESEEKFRAFSESSQTAIWAFRDNTTFYGNQAYLDLTGYSWEELRRPGFHIDQVLHPDDQEAMRERMKVWLAGDRRVRWPEHRIITKSGETRIVRMANGMFALGDGVAGIASAFDITDRVRAEEERARAVAFSDATTNSMPGVFYLISSEGLFLRTNDRFKEVSGYSEDEISGMSPLDFFRDGEKELIAERIGAVFVDGEATASANFVSKDGTATPYFFTGKRVMFEGALCLAGLGVDVSAQAAAEASRARIQRYLQTVLEAAPVGLWGIDTERVFTFAEGRAAAGSLVGKHISALTDDPGAAARIERALAGEAFSDVVEWGDRHRETHYSPVRDANGSVTGVIGVTIDVTDRRKAELAMLQSQKLESLGVLAGGIAHDFNNLLVAILGNAGIALMELPPESSARDTIHEIEKAGQRAADLARQMLAYSGKGKFVIERLDLSALVEEMTHLLRVSISKATTVTYDFAPWLPAIEVDPTQIRQVVMNLVVNASDAIGSAPGSIAVRTGISQETRESLAGAYLAPDLPGGEYVFLEVVDTGIGMDEETLARIFDPFFTTKFTGRGLGLAAVLGIIRGHRGAVRIASQVGKGTTFQVLFPAEAEPADAETAAPKPEDWRGTGTIVVADDEGSVRVVTARALRMLGFDVMQCADGSEAVAAVRGVDGVVCVLLDMTMPGMSGEEAFRQVQAISPGTPVVIMTGYNEQDTEARFAGERPAGFLQKPYELSTLRKVIREAIEGPGE